LLDRLGVWSTVVAKAAPLRTMRIIDGTRRLVRAPEVEFDAGEIGLPAFGYNVPNEELVAALERTVAARNIQRVDSVAEAATPSPDRITISVEGDRQVEARLAVAADGRRSRLRDCAGIAVKTWQYDQAALVCNIDHTLPHHDTSTEFHTEHGPFTLVPLGKNRSSVVWVDRPDACERRRRHDDETLAAEIEERSASILGAVVVNGGRQVFPLSGLTVDHFAAARVMLAGEAAHLFPPIGAQGLNLGYRDVAAMLEVLAGPIADPGAEGALADYDAARRLDVLSRTAAIDALNRTLLTSFLPVQALRGLGLFLVDRVPALRRFAIKQGLGIDA
jgi:2-octaprenyl-6-methoxyphenol hydroxylase